VDPHAQDRLPAAGKYLCCISGVSSLSLTFAQVSVAAGAIIAGASKQDIAACELFAEKIGLAFQSTCRVEVCCSYRIFDMQFAWTFS
jgi:hypothetical protein